MERRSEQETPGSQGPVAPAGGTPSAPPARTAGEASGIRFRDRWERTTRWPLLVLSVAFIVAYSYLVLVPEAPGALTMFLAAVLAAAWLAFIVDFSVRAATTPRGERSGYLRSHKVHLASVVLPLLRLFWLLRLLNRMPIFQGNGGTALRSRVVVIAISSTAMFVYVIALTELSVERGAPHATIITFGNAVWWACVTIATVGYGDFTPVTWLGRVFGVVLMIGGVAIIGTSSALIVSYLSERITHRVHDGQPLGRHDDVSGDNFKDQTLKTSDSSLEHPTAPEIAPEASPPENT